MRSSKREGTCDPLTLSPDLPGYDVLRRIVALFDSQFNLKVIQLKDLLIFGLA